MVKRYGLEAANWPNVMIFTSTFNFKEEHSQLPLLY